MIRAVIFDLDGVLVRTEELKALSYARAAVRLCPDKVNEAVAVEAYRETVSDPSFGVANLCAGGISESDAVEAYKEVVGRSRQEVAESLMRRLGLEEAARALMPTFGVKDPWRAFVKVRLDIYEAMISDPEVLRSNVWPHNLALLHRVRDAGYLTALATMSDREHVGRVLDVLGLTHSFDLIVTADDITRGKPDPETYHFIAKGLKLSPRECLVIEDSPSGIQAGLAAGMHVIAVTTPITRKAVHDARLIDARFIVDEPADLDAIVDHTLSDAQRSTSP